ncbi:hypothetical protein MMC28_007627 [Mycoblastus sanguinarius]|nr:hypothetical protein [Mycoblastus sanguinarius]
MKGIELGALSKAAARPMKPKGTRTPKTPGTASTIELTAHRSDTRWSEVIQHLEPKDVNKRKISFFNSLVTLENILRVKPTMLSEFQGANNAI